MRVFLTGVTGRLGSAFAEIWENDPNYEVVALTRADLDLSRPTAVRDLLAKENFDVLVNPAAVSGIEQCLDHPDEAYAVNTLSPAVMAQICREKNARLVHFSTDYVFSGDQPNRPTEQTPTSAINVYGRTKAEGEHAVLSNCKSSLVCRVSWLFGHGPQSHFDQVLQQAHSTDNFTLIDDKYSVPTYTADIVGWTEALIEGNHRGIFHLCNSGKPESWHSYAETICELAAELGIISSIPTIDRLPLCDAHFFRDARPRHTAMLPTRLIEEDIAQPRDWIEAAKEYLKSH